MGQLVRVAISYDLSIQSRLDFSLLSEFFRSIGVFVHENVRLQKGKGSFLEPLYSAEYPIIWLGEERDLIESHAQVCFFSDLRSKYTSGDESILALPVENVTQILMDLLNALQCRVDAALIDVFLKHDIVKHSLNLQYFPSRKSWAAEEAESAFTQGYEELAGREGELSGDFYSRYARIWYGMRSDEACQLIDRILRYEIPMLAVWCKTLIADYPERSNAKVLLGLCYRMRNDFMLDAVRVFSDALRDESGYPYASSIYYWIGKCYQPYSVHTEKAEQNYIRSYDKNGAYKSRYKMATMKEKKGSYKDYEAAVEYYKSLVDSLYPKCRSKLLNPIELEYMFKAYHQIAYLSYSVLKNRKRDVIWGGERAVKLWDAKDDVEAYWRALYGDGFEDYWRLSRSRLCINSVCRMLSDCYEALGEHELAKQYSDMMRL